MLGRTLKIIALSVLLLVLSSLNSFSIHTQKKAVSGKSCRIVGCYKKVLMRKAPEANCKIIHLSLSLTTETIIGGGNRNWTDSSEINQSIIQPLFNLDKSLRGLPSFHLQ